MRSKTRFTVIAAGTAAALALVTGCSTSDDSTTSGENTEVCNNFATDHNEFVGLVMAGPGTADNLEQWTTDKQAAVDKIVALTGGAGGDVASSLTAFSDGLPAETLELSEPDSVSGKAFVDNGAAVASACEADGTAITLDQLPLTSFDN